MRPATLVLALATLWPPATPAQENWPRLRGADATGVVADDPRLPDTWDRKTNAQWTTEIPGYGWSSPIVWGDRVFVTSVHSDQTGEAPKAGLYLGQGRQQPPPGVHHWMVYGLSLATGEVVWKQEAHRGEPTFPRHPKNTYASETPTTDGERLYVLFGDLGVYAYDLAGHPLWSHPIAAKKSTFGYGAAASPIVHQGQVIMVYDNMEDSYIASYDAATGAERWRVPRDEPSTWSTPFLWPNERRTEVVVAGNRRNRSYDLDGKLLWDFDGHMSSLTIPSPFAAEGLLYITSGYFSDNPRPAYAILPGGSGDIGLADGETANQYIRWYQPTAGPYNPTPIVYRGLYYTLFDRGFLTCHDAKTGEPVYDKQRFSGAPSFTASPWAYNGKLFFLSEDGETYVVEAGREYREIRTNDLDELAIATPSIAQGKLLIRTASRVYCLSQSTL
jgi:outer membrane protein assembly factor BamB